MNNIIDKIRVSGTDYTLSATSSGGNPTVELTQAEYDALVSAGTVSADTYYIITDAQAGDLTQYWTSAQTQSAITQATSGKVNTSSVVSSVTSASTDNEIPTAKAVYDAIPQGGGGGGITSGEVQSMIDESISGKANSSDATYQVNASTQNNGIYFVTLDKGGSQIDYSFEPQIRFQAPLYSDYDDGKVKISGVTAITSASTDNEIPTAKAVFDALGGGGGSITIDPSLDSGSTNAVANSAITDTIYNQTARFDGMASYGYGVNILFNEGTGNYMGISLAKLKTTANGISQTSSGAWCRISTINGKKVFSTNAANVSDFSLVETSAITTAITSSSTDAQVPSAKAVYDIVGNIETLLSQI